MNLTVTLSLEQRALTNIAISLWSQNDIRHLLSKFALHKLNVCWKGIEKLVIVRSTILPLPKSLKEKLLECIVRVGSQIILWVDFHYWDYGVVAELPAVFVWTSLGTINTIKTAKLLVMSGTLVSDASFALACMYCLEDEIKYFWNTFDLSLRTSKFNCLYFVSYWSDYMDEFKMENRSSDSNSYKSLILESVKSGNKAATRYFLRKVNKRDRNSVIVLATAVISSSYTLKNKNYLQLYSDIMLFLLSEMNSEQQVELFSKHSFSVLLCLLVWPWQSLFLENVKDKWCFISKRNFNNLLHCMAAFMHLNPNLHELFEEFWQQSPETYKRYITEPRIHYNLQTLILNLYRSEDEKNVKLILKHTRMYYRERILIYSGHEHIFKCLVSSEKWNSLQFLIQECISSAEDLIGIRDTMREYVTKLQDVSIKAYQWHKFFDLLDCGISYVTKKNTKQKTRVYVIAKKHLHKCIEDRSEDEKMSSLY